ncbi:MAG: polysulfide reductase NrfD [Burkholderiales bacterium]|nr:polysulfide reductase NrfD [Burkholderiales bacterium]
MTAATLPRSGSAGALFGVAGLVVTGGFVIWQLIAHGHAAYNTTSNGLMWGLPIVTYDFFLMSSCGAALVASLWSVLGLEGFEPVARRALWIALALLIGGVAALFLELGNPLRSLYAIPLNVQVKAPLFWKVLGVGVYAVCLLVMAAGWLAQPAGARKPPTLVSVVGALAALFVVLTGAFMFATLSMRPFWFSGEVPVMILVEAMLGGLAFVLLATHRAGAGDEATHAAVAGPLPRFAAVLIFVTLLFLVGRAVVGLASNLDGMQVWSHIAGSLTFWVQIAFLVAALYLTAVPAARAGGGAQTLAMVLVIVALFLGKYEFVIGGQLVPLFKGTWVPGLIDYAPSATEFALLAMSAFLAYAIYAYGADRFRLGAAR